MKQLFLFFSIIMFGAACMFAQSNIQIIDILVSPIVEVDTITNLPINSDSEKLAILCKINDLTEVQTVQILVGTTEYSGDIMSISANIVIDNEEAFLVYNNESFEITDNVITANVELSQSQSELYNFISIYVIDENNQESNHLVFTK